MTIVLDPRPLCKDLEQLAREVLPPEIFNKLGVSGLKLMDERILQTVVTLRKLLNKPITINDWSWGGRFDDRGLRVPSSYDSIDKYLSSRSQHKYGRALDFHVKGMAHHEVRKFIIENKYKFPHVNFMEVGINWVHIDCRMPLDNNWCKFWHPDEGYVTEQEVIVRGL